VAVCQASKPSQLTSADLALAGGIYLTFRKRAGVSYQEGGSFHPMAIAGHVDALQDAGHRYRAGAWLDCLL